MKTRIRLLVFDLDGTALGGHMPYDQFPRDFALFLDRLSRRGIRWATATAWWPNVQFPMLLRSGVTSRPAFLAGDSGRLLATVERGKLRYDRGYERHIKALDRRFRRRNQGRVRKILARLLARGLVDQAAYNKSGQNTLTFVATPGCATKVWRELKPLLADGQFYVWNPVKKKANGLVPHYMNKADIIRAMQHRLGIGPEQTIVAGDECNDLHMFDPAIARYMVCPANAVPMIKARVKQHGGIVATRRFSWGVMEGVEKILNNR